MIASANASTGGILSTLPIRAVLGFTRLLLSWQLYVVTASHEVGRIGPHLIHAVDEVQLIPITHASAFDSSPHAARWRRWRAVEGRYRALLLSMDLSRNFYFSHTYDLTRTLQVNMVAGGQGRHPQGGVKDMYVWNHHFRLRPTNPSPYSSSPSSPPSPLHHELSRSDWCIALVHGYFEQVTLSILGRPLTLTLISRRSRHFAGTRYLKRGINERGQAANDVETEQLLHDRSAGDPQQGQFTAYVTMRASIPVHWTQESNPMIAQPAIVMQKLDPLHRSTRRHVQDCWRRYGSPLLVLNLVKQSESSGRRREVIIGAAYAEAVDFLNHWVTQEEHRVDYLAWDFKKASKSKQASVMDELTVIAHWALQRTGLFHSRPRRDARLVTAAATRGLKPTRESLREWGVEGLPQRKPEKAKDGEGGEGEEEEKETDSAHLQEGGRGEDERKDLSARSGGDLTPLLTPMSAPFLLSSIRDQKERDRQLQGSARDFDSAPRSARYHDRSSSDEVNGGPSSLSSLSPSPFPSSPLPLPPSSSFASSSAFPSSSHRRTLINHAFLQRGVCRANCVDSLDRTNAASYALGRVALSYQLHALTLLPYPSTDHLGALGPMLLDMYERMGDAIALQYGGSQMHRQIKADATPLPPSAASPAPSPTPSTTSRPSLPLPLFSSLKTKQPKELITSIVRHYQNSFQDTSKQDAMNLFLGLYRPYERGGEGVQLWDMGSDYYLHNPPDDAEVGTGGGGPRRGGEEDEVEEEGEGEREGEEEGWGDEDRAAYDDPAWWQSPMLDNERLQGPFAASPSVLFPPHPKPAQSFSASTPVLPTLAHLPPPPLRSISSPSPPSHPPPSPTPIPPLKSDIVKADPVHDDEPTSPSSPSLSWLLSYGPLSVLTEFDSLLTHDAAATPRTIFILGVDKTKEEVQPEAPTTLLSPPPPSSSTPTHPHPPLLSTKKSRSRKSRRLLPAVDAPHEPAAWEVEGRVERETAEEARKARVYSVDSSYALPCPLPSVSPAVVSRYEGWVGMQGGKLLIPEASVAESEAVIEQARVDAEARKEQGRRRAREKAELEQLQRRADREKEDADSAGEAAAVHQLPSAPSPANSRLSSAIVKQSIGVAGLALAARKVSVTERDVGLPALSSFVVSVDPMDPFPPSHPQLQPPIHTQPHQRRPPADGASPTIAEAGEPPCTPSPLARSPSSTSSSSPWESEVSDTELPLSEEQLVMFRLYFAHLRSCEFSVGLWRAAFRAHGQGQLAVTEVLRGGKADEAYRASEGGCHAQVRQHDVTSPGDGSSASQRSYTHDGYGTFHVHMYTPRLCIAPMHTVLMVWLRLAGDGKPDCGERAWGGHGQTRTRLTQVDESTSHTRPRAATPTRPRTRMQATSHASQTAG